MKNIENDTKFRAAVLGALIARHYPEATPHRVALVVSEMQRAAKSSKAFAVDACIRDLGDPDEYRSAYARRKRAQDRRQTELNERLAFAHLHKFVKHPAPATLKLGGDPRGAVARLHIPGQRGDGLGDGFAVF